MPNDLLNSTICLESLICVAQVPMMEQIMRSPLFLVLGIWGSHSCLSEKRPTACGRAERGRRRSLPCFSGYGKHKATCKLTH